MENEPVNETVSLSLKITKVLREKLDHWLAGVQRSELAAGRLAPSMNRALADLILKALDGLPQG
jgi:hypothetical protein